MQMRTTKPSVGNKYYIRQVSGGWNGAIQGKPTDPSVNVLANCVGYANGRFAEIQNENRIKFQLVSNAVAFIERAIAQGLTISDKPILGGIMVWGGGSTGAGHVAICERIDIDNEQVYTSESAWNSTTFYNQTRRRGNGNWGASSAYYYRGCIVNPSVNAEVPPTPPSPPSETKYTVVRGDTVSKIAQKFYGKSTKTEWDKIRFANNLNANYLIIVGQSLIIPDVGSSPSGPSTVGLTKIFRNNHTKIYPNADLTGNPWDYLANTSVVILENLAGGIDKIRVRVNGREGYVSNSVYK